MESKEKNKGILIILVFFVALTIILGGYILYDKVLSKSNDETSNTNIKDTNSDEVVQNKEYKVLSDNEKTYLAVKDNSGYKVIYNLGNNIHYIGIYNNKLYYSDTKIKYIDLTETTLTENVWLEIPQPKCDPTVTGCADILISKSTIVGSNLFFNVNTSAAGTEDTDGLLSISMNASNFSDFKKISPLAEEWFVDEDNENIYYMNFYRDDNVVYKYNIASANAEKLFNTTGYSDRISYVSNNIVYYNKTKDELSLYNVNSGSSTTLANNLSEVFRYNGSMWGIVSVVGKNLYYYDGKGTIMKYDSTNDSKTNYYKISDTFYYRGYTFYDDDNFEITYDCYKYNGNDQGHTCTKTSEYISNNKVVESFPNINVIMLDGSSKNFTIKNFQ